MTKEQAKNLIGLNASYRLAQTKEIKGKITRIGTADNERIILAELNTGLLVNIELLSITGLESDSKK